MVGLLSYDNGSGKMKKADETRLTGSMVIDLHLDG